MSPRKLALAAVEAEAARLVAAGWRLNLDVSSKWERILFRGEGWDEESARWTGCMLRLTALGSTPGLVMASMSDHDANLSATLQAAWGDITAPLARLLTIGGAR